MLQYSNGKGATLKLQVKNLWMKNTVKVWMAKGHVVGAMWHMFYAHQIATI